MVTSLTAISGPRPSRPDGGRQRHDGRPAAAGPQHSGGRPGETFLFREECANPGSPRDLARGVVGQGKKVADRRLRDRGRRAAASASRRLIRQPKAAGMRRSQARQGEPRLKRPSPAMTGSTAPSTQARTAKKLAPPFTIEWARLDMPGHQRNRAPHRCGPRACRRDRTRRPASRRRSRRVLQQRGDQRIGRSEPPAAQLRRDDRFHGLQLCRRVHAQIDFRGADIGMTEPQSDLSNVMRGLKHDHRATVPQLMRRYRAPAQGWTGMGRTADVLVQHIFEAGSCHRPAFGIDEELRCANIPPHGQPSPQIGRGFLPERKGGRPAATSRRQAAGSEGASRAT